MFQHWIQSKIPRSPTCQHLTPNVPSNPWHGHFVLLIWCICNRDIKTFKNMYNSLSRPGCDSECQWHLVGWDPGLVMNDFFVNLWLAERRHSWCPVIRIIIIVIWITIVRLFHHYAQTKRNKQKMRVATKSNVKQVVLLQSQAQKN